MPGITSLPKVAGTSSAQKAAACSITPWAAKGDAPKDKLASLRFQYFPESWSDNKAVNWASKEIPGASLPLYQFVAGGERTISFTAFFTSDVDLHATGRFFGSPTGTSLAVTKNLVTEQRLSKSGVTRRNVDVKSALVWLRALLLPSYSTQGNVLNVPLTRPPRTLLLTIPNSGIGLMGGDFPSLQHDSILCIMNQCDITIEQFWPSGAPRLAQVGLAFVQVAQNPANNTILFPGASSEMHKVWMEGGRTPIDGGDGKAFWGYKLKADSKGKS